MRHPKRILLETILAQTDREDQGRGGKMTSWLQAPISTWHMLRIEMHGLNLFVEPASSVTPRGGGEREGGRDREREGVFLLSFT